MRCPFQIPWTSQNQSRLINPRDWRAHHATLRNEKCEFMRLLYDPCQTIPQLEYEFGLPLLALVDMVFSTALKVYRLSPVAAQEKGCLMQVPHYSTLYRYTESDDFTPILHNLIGVSGASLQLVESQFAANSSGFSTSSSDRWYEERYGRERSQHL